MELAPSTPENLERAAAHYFHLMCTAMVDGTTNHLRDEHGMAARDLVRMTEVAVAKLHADAHDVPNVPDAALRAHMGIRNRRSPELTA